MVTRKLSYIFPGVLVSLSAHTATLVGITDDTIYNYLSISKKTLASADSNYKYELTKTIELTNGVIKNKYSLYYKGVKVFNTDISSTDVDGKQMNWYGEMLTDIQEDLSDVTPAFSEEAIIAKMKKNYKTLKSNIIKNESAKLYIRMNKDKKAELIYLVSFNVEGENVARPFFMVNAKTGEIINQWDGLTTRDAEGPGGNQKTGAYYYGRDFGHLIVSDDCSMTNDQVETYDMKNQLSGGVLHKFVCPVNTYKSVNGAYSPINDAHYFGQVVFNMYKNWYLMSPLTTKLRLNVHWGNRYENAFWDGRAMNFGDGANRMYPYTGALDILAHEVSHGVTEQSSDLVYAKQSGGMNEAFSDMAGETAEFYMNQEVGKENDWLGGAAVMKNEVAMRYFKEPTQDGYSIDNAKDYNDSLNVHFTSGIYNKAFYTLATKPNWGIRKAFNVFLTANRVYWKPESTFDSGACGVAKAAADLKYEVNDVISAFKVVGVNAGCVIPTPPDTPTDPSKETELPNAGSANITVAPNYEYRYLIKVPVVRTFPYSYDLLQIRLFNPTGTASSTAELYVRYEDGFLTQLKPISFAGKDEIFQIRKPSAGIYHIVVKGKANGTVTLNAFYGNLK